MKEKTIEDKLKNFIGVRVRFLFGMLDHFSRIEAILLQITAVKLKNTSYFI